MKLRKSYIVSLIVVICAIITVILANTVAKQSNKAPAKGGRGATVVSVRTKVLNVETLHGYVSTNGEIESQNSVSVFPDTVGKIMETSVMLGSTVKRGEILGYVDPSTPGSYFKKSPVYAPISGSVISTPLKNGTTVSTNTAICVIGDIKNLQVNANVPERYVSVLKVGLKADISVEAYPDVKFKATVKRVSPVVDASSRTKQVILTFDEKDERINAGMFAKVILFTEDYEGFVTMPKDSIVQNGDNYFAYVVKNDSTVSKKKIELGKTVDGVVQIVKGLNEGDRVVIQGQTSLADGSKINDIGNDSEKKKENGKMKDERGKMKKDNGVGGRK